MNIYNIRYEEELNAAVESEIICNDKFCPYHYKHMSSPSHPTCEGEYCDIAFQNYIEEGADNG